MGSTVSSGTAEQATPSGTNRTYRVFHLLGLAYLALGIGWWLHDRQALDLWLAGVGFSVMLTGYGCYLAATKFLPQSISR